MGLPYQYVVVVFLGRYGWTGRGQLGNHKGCEGLLESGQFFVGQATEELPPAFGYLQEILLRQVLCVLGKSTHQLDLFNVNGGKFQHTCM